MVLRLLVEYFRRHCVMLVYLNWNLIKLGHGLDLDVITPDLVALILRDILSNGPVALRVDEAHEVFTLQVDVFLALQPDNCVVLVVAVKLPRNCTIKTVSVVGCLQDGEACDSLHFFFELFVSFILLDLGQLLFLKCQFCRVKLLCKAIE